MCKHDNYHYVKDTKLFKIYTQNYIFSERELKLYDIQLM